MKRITVAVPVYNEIQNLDEAYERITAVMQSLENYDYEIVFFDDGSADGSREKEAEFCAKDAHVKAVQYAKNFGYIKNTFYCMQQAKGDCAILVHADMQNPPELIPQLIEKWEAGAKTVVGVKTKSKENGFLFFLRTLFYLIMNKVFRTKLIPHATEFELFDKSFIDVLKQVRSVSPYLRALVLEYSKPELIYYTQDKRRKGKSKFSLSKYYDFALGGVVSMSKNLPRLGVAVSLAGGLACVLEFFINFLPDMLRGGVSSLADSLLLRGIFLFLCFAILLFSVISEYVISVAERTDEKPMIVEEKRINY